MTKTAANPVSLGITNMAVLPVVGGNYVASSETGHVFVVRSSEVFSNDADENLLSDRRWNYTWNAENRLIKVESRSDTPSSSWRRIEWTYDAVGRRIQQVTSIWTNNAWFVVENLKFVSDPMLFGRHIVELNATNNTPVRSYVWGLDLSGTMDGAGGVSGLLWVTLHTASGPASGAHFTCYDGNGNIVALVNAATSDITARYEYGPFGEPIRISGPVAAMNPFSFSTKRTDNTTDFVLYEYRIYNPTLGCWPNRDPIAERGGLNVNGCVENNPINRWDVLGMISEDGDWPPPPNLIDSPPSGPFFECRIALSCTPIYRYGVYLGDHCGLLVDTGDGVYAVHGSGGTVNSRWVTPGNAADATQPWTDNDPSTCQCLFLSVKPWNERRVPRDNLCANSNWNLRCAIKKCKIRVDWGSQSKPMGYDCKECIQWVRVGAVPPGAFACDRCLEWKEKPCPDQ